MPTRETTVTANEPLAALLGRMRSLNVNEVLVTTPEDRLLGAVQIDIVSRSRRVVGTIGRGV